MKLLIASHNITEKNCHLMPWRTVCEVTNHLRDKGENVTLVSLGNINKEIWRKSLPTGTREIRKSYEYLEDDLGEIIKKIKPDIIYWPISWREPVRRIRLINKFNVPFIGYFPGSCFSLHSVIYALMRIGLYKTLPYLLESISHKPTKSKILKKSNFQRIIAMTEQTARCVLDSGWADKEVFAIPPGRDNDDLSDFSFSDLPIEFNEWLNGRPYYLFTGPPAAIRGIYELIDAYDIAADEYKDICLVCLFRSDEITEKDKVKEKIKRIRHKERIYVIWESIEKNKLESFIRNCHAVVMPFIIVPSEIPLAIIESMKWGKPVISTSEGGTGQFVSSFSSVINVGDIPGLANALLSFVYDEETYLAKCKATLNKYRELPTWEQIAFQWLKVAKSLEAPL